MESSNDDTLNDSYLENLSNQAIVSVTTMTKTLNCDTTTLSPTNSLSSDLSPRNCSIKKPIRRRSRASKKTPTTHLSADASNFRALVQQFTGCHTANTFLGAHKGPINLNFGVLDHNEDPIILSSFEYDHRCCNFMVQPERQELMKEKKMDMKNQEEKIKGILSVDHRIVGSSSTTNSSSPTMDNIVSLDDFELENLSLHDFTGELFTSTENIWDDGYLL